MASWSKFAGLKVLFEEWAKKSKNYVEQARLLILKKEKLEREQNYAK